MTLLVDPTERPAVVAQAFGFCPVEYAYYLLGSRPWFNILKSQEAGQKIYEQTGTEFMPWVGRGFSSIYLPGWKKLPEWINERLHYEQGLAELAMLEKVPIVGMYVRRRLEGGNYVLVTQPQKLPAFIDTGHGIAELVKAAVNGGFDNGPEVDFLSGVVYSAPEKREFFEMLGFRFFVADFDYKTPGTLPIYSGTFDPKSKTVSIKPFE